MNNILNLRTLFIACVCGLAVTACSDSSDSKQTATPEPAAQAPAHPPMQQNMQQGAAPQGQKPLSAAQQAAITAAKNLPREGTVLEMMHAAGYTYMNVDVGSDKSMWIAASMMRVKPQQKIQWSDAAVMNNFKSKSLHRTFDQILFVSNAQVVQ